jgi:hypothetical protein
VAAVQRPEAVALAAVEKLVFVPWEISEQVDCTMKQATG